MPSFDIVCELNLHEVNNAVDQANREVNTRFDFKDAKAKFSCQDNCVTLIAQADFHLKQMLDILNTKFAKRGVDIRHMQVDPPQISLHQAEQKVTLQQGIADDIAKKIVKLVKEQKLKVQTAIQGDKLRVTGKNRDDLQQVIKFLKDQPASIINLPLQFNNFRD